MSRALPTAQGYAPSHQSPHGADVPTASKKMAIEAVGLKKYFGAQKVLDGVTMSIPESEITMIMGPSGTGKSVFLRHVVGLMFPDSGDIRVAGHSVPHLSTEGLLELRQNVGMLDQDEVPQRTGISNDDHYAPRCRSRSLANSACRFSHRRPLVAPSRSMSFIGG